MIKFNELIFSTPSHPGFSVYLISSLIRFSILLNYYFTLEDVTKLKEVLYCLKMGVEIQSSEGGCSLLAAFCGKLVH